MTIKDLYEWAKENNVLDYNIEIQYRDDGGCYDGREALDAPYVPRDEKNVVVL